jgi:hypothetical protein
MMLIGAILMFLALIPFLGWPIYKRFATKPVSTALFERTKAAVEKNPKLKPEWDKAMEDGILTWPEAKDILEKAGETVEPEE